MHFLQGLSASCDIVSLSSESTRDKHDQGSGQFLRDMSPPLLSLYVLTQCTTLSGRIFLRVTICSGQHWPPSLGYGAGST